MSIGESSLIKTIAQSSIRTTSRILAGQTTDFVLSAAGAYIYAVRGLGWSPLVDEEASCAARCLGQHREFIVLDAGANVGRWSAAFRKRVATKGRIFAFEPQPEAAKKIRELDLDDCEVVQAALGEEPGKKTLYTSSHTDSMASLYWRRDTFVRGREYTSTEVEVIRLDDWVKMRGIDRIDFMKMDLEGAEFQALQGASDCMQEGILRAFSFEFGISNVNSRVFFRDIFNLVRERRYEVFRATPAGRLVHVPAYSEEHECFARTTTYFARYKVY